MKRPLLSPLVSLKKTLDRFYREYDFSARLSDDPIEILHRYQRKEDIEAAGFLAAAFAYGRVDLFKPVVERLLSLMGESPYDFMRRFDLRKHRRIFGGLKYRFNETEDIISLVDIVGRVLKTHGSIEALFKAHFRESDLTIAEGLSGMVQEFLDADVKVVYGRSGKPPGLLQFFPSPEKGSTCKRMNLFLRWMIRDRDIDFGIWKDIPKNKLIIPLDTHIARISRCLGFTARKSQDWKMAVEITESLKKFDPEDPLKYDFALCHQGIAGLCRADRCGRCDSPLRQG